jgi:hypothetical protein
MKSFLEYVYIKSYLRYVKHGDFDGFVERYTFMPTVWASLIFPYLAALVLISMIIKKEIFGQTEFAKLPSSEFMAILGFGVIPISLSLLVVRTGLHDRIMNKAPKYENRSPWLAYFFLFSGLILLFSVFFLLVYITNSPNYKQINH